MSEILKTVADNQALTEALKEVILKQFDEESVSTSLNNESLGQVTRARLDGIKKVNLAFIEIGKYKTVKEIPKEDNPAR